MKKNFLKVAALLIAAMLMVVSCTQEIAPKNEDNGLVPASIGLAYGKDVTVDYGDENATIKYQYKLTAQWKDLDNGAPIYGNSSSWEDLFNGVGKTINANLSNADLKYVTPGYWLIEVQGLVNDKVVLKGSTKAYFSKNNNNPTVYVAPVENGEAKGSITLELVMEDLDSTDAEEGTGSKVYYLLDGADDNDTNRVYLRKGSKVTAEDGKNSAHNYSVTTDTITSGYHTITIKVKEYDGGITKSFLMIPGNSVTIEGSIYPSKFIDSDASLVVVSLGKGTITVGEGSTAVLFNNSYDGDPAVVTGGSSVKVSISGIALPSGMTGNINYEWYVNGAKKEDVSNATTANITIDNVPGDYNITCIAKYTYAVADGTSLTVYGCEECAAKVRVETVSSTTSETTV